MSGKPRTTPHAFGCTNTRALGGPGTPGTQCPACEPPTDTVFRVFTGKDADPEPFALFPGVPGTNDPGTCSSYHRMGQHSSADVRRCMAASRPATPKEYEPLRRELDRLRKAKKRASDPAYYAAELSRNRVRARLRYVPRARKTAKTPQRMLGKCAICPHVCKGKTKLDVLHFDHCHKTNRHRGWLCRSCNLLLGYAKDSPEVLLAAIRYLEYNRNSTPSE